MKKFFRGKLSAKLALVAILANTLTSPVGVIAEETTGEENQTPKISLQNLDTGGKDAVEPEETFNATLTGDFENLKETNTKAITFTLNSEFALGENPVSKTEGVKVVKLTDTNFSLDFSGATEDKQNFAVELPLTAKVDSANEDAQLVLSSEHTQDLMKTFKVNKLTLNKKVTRGSTWGSLTSALYGTENYYSFGGNKGIGDPYVAGSANGDQSFGIRDDINIIFDDPSYLPKITILTKLNGTDVTKFFEIFDANNKTPGLGFDYNDFSISLSPNNLADAFYERFEDNKYEAPGVVLHVEVFKRDSNGSIKTISDSRDLNMGGKSSYPIRIQKEAEDGVIEGIEFEFQVQFPGYDDWETLERVKTNSKGQAIVVLPDVYTYMGPNSSLTKIRLVEVMNSEKYLPRIFEFDMRSQVQSGIAPIFMEKVKIENTIRKGEIEIKKIDSAEKSKSLAGATFKVINEDTNEVFLEESAPTNTSGYLKISNIPYGNYILEEKTPPSGYQLSAEKKKFSITKDTSESDYVIQHFDFENTKVEEPKGKIKITKVDGAAPSTKLAGATFKIMNSVTNKVWLAESERTASNGELTITDIPIGKYTLEEVKSPTGYDLSTEKKAFEVTSTNATTLQTFNFENTKSEEPLGKVKITKVDSAAASTKLAGATFKITNKDTDKVWLAESNPTASNGELTISNIPVGKYVLSEVKAPTGYDLSKETIDFEVTVGNASTLQTFDFENTKSEEPLGKVKITKVDSAAASTKLAGATFKITNKDTNKVWLAESNPTASNGELTISNIPVGKYVLSEVKAPNGYDLSKETIDFEVTAGNASTLQTFNFENTKSEEPLGKVKITKVDSAAASTKLAGATFKITNADTDKVWLAESNPTAANGELTISNIPVGKYVLSEVKAPNGYDLSKETIDFEVTAGNASTLQTFNFENTKSEEPLGKVKITKVDSAAASTKLAGATFKIANKDTDKVWLAESNPTAANGELTISNIPVGKYVLSEVKAPNGYDLSKETINFEVTAGNAATLQTFNFKNTKTPEPEKGKVTIKKYKDGDTTEALIADAEFTLYDADDKKISSQTTVEGKELVFDNLEYGKYTLKETKAPAGYEESTETKPVFEKEFEVTAADLNFEYKVANVPTPSRQTGKVSIKKYKDGDTTEALIGDAEFTLYDADGNEVAKKTTVKGEELVFDSLAYGKYTLKETKAPAGYEESTEAKPLFEKEFEVTAGELSFEYKVANKEIPEIQTSARDGETGTNEGYADEKVTIIDEVKYENLTIGKKYTVKGTLMDQATNQPFLTKDGKEVHAETSFDAEKTSGTVELTFEITNGDLQGKTVVVFEDLETEGKKVATHSDITDEKQSVDYPKVGTQASKATKDDKITVTDIVSYEKLTVGKEYTVKGTLMDKETGKAFEVDGKAVTAETPFKPAAENGTTEVTFEFDKSAIEGKEISLVVFEKVFNADGKVIGTHEDLKDSAQTVEFKPDTPVIETSAKDSETGTNEGNADEKVTIIDTVTYKNLTIGKDYTVKGVLMDKGTNQPFLTKDGKEVHAEKDFTADKSNGTIDLEFVITNGDLAGKIVVVFETLYREGVEVAVHADIEDKNQSVDYPKVGTKASKSFAGDTITVTDIVSYEKLTVGKEYTVKGTLMDKETGKAFEVDGKAVTAEAPFTPTEENGTTEVTFEFDRKAIEGKEISLVVFEKVLNADGKVIGTHEDLEDSEQTVEFNPDTPEISTTAKDSETGTNEGYADEKVSIIDTVHYDNLTIGKTYTVSGVLMDKATNQPFLTKDGKEVRAEKEFVPDATNGSVDLEFEITNGDLQGKTVVVFETLYRDGKEVAAHTDIEDKDQSVDYPKVGTKASEKTVGDKIVVTDIVAYEKLTVGKKYTVKGTLMDKATGKAFEVDGKAVTAEATFTPETENGTTEVSFEFAQKAIEGKEISLVVFEKVLNADGKVIGTHEDLEDPDQTVPFNPDTPEISTKAKDKGTASNEGHAKKDVTIIDEVSYRNLIVGKEYTVKGVLMDKATNQPLLANGKEVCAEKTFTAKKPNGTIDLEFTFDGSALAGATVVVFETLYTDNKEVATHTDINDADQTVTYPKVGTKASESTVDNTVVIKDIVSYENLVVGKKYTVKGVLMDKSTGLAYRVDGKKVLGETTFVAETASGTVEVAFEFAKSALTKKETLVVFEQLFNSKGYIVGAHEDINDKDQTVEVGDDTPGKPGLPSTNTKSGGRTYSYGTSTSRGSLPKTGSVTNPLFVILGLIIIGSAVTFYFVYIRRAKRNH